MRNIEANADQNVNKILVGNKCDNEGDRVITTEEGQQMANRLGIPFIETSAKNSWKVEDCFISLARDVIQRLGENAQQGQNGYIDPTLQNGQSQEAQGCC